MTKKQWREICEKAAEQADVEVHFYDDKTGRDDAFEDDGTLHVRRQRLRACFDVSPHGRLVENSQNSKTRRVMVALGLPVTERVLVDESDNEEWD